MQCAEEHAAQPSLPPARAQMANVPVIAVENHRVEHGDGFTLPVVSLADRRAAGHRLVRWVYQKHLEVRPRTPPPRPCPLPCTARGSR